MTEEEMQAAIDKANASIAKLEAKNSELIDREKAAKKAAEEAEDARQAAADDAASKSGDIEAIKTSLANAHAKELKKLTDANAALNKSLEKLTVDDAISSAIAKAGVLPHAVRAATLMLKDGVVFENGAATVNGVPFADHIASELAGEAFAPFIAATNNSGAGARGSTTPGKAPMTSLTEMMAAAKKDPNSVLTANVSPELAAVQKSLS